MKSKQEVDKAVILRSANSVNEKQLRRFNQMLISYSELIDRSFLTKNPSVNW